MKQRIKVIMVDSVIKEYFLVINPETLSGIKNDMYDFQFGMRIVKVRVLTDINMNLNEMKLSKGTIDYLNIFTTYLFDCTLNEDRLIIGPFIGLLMTRGNKKLTEKLAEINKYVKHYDEIGGAVVAFSLEGVNKHQNLVEGYYYNPEKEDWEFGIYPYPGAIIKTISLNKNWRNYFQKVFENKIFNLYNFNKWEMYKWLKKNSTMKKYLPKTVLYRQPSDIIIFLSTHKQAFIKPINSSFGREIVKVSKTRRTYLIQYQEKNDYYERTLDATALKYFFRKKLKRQKYIIQKALTIDMKKNRIADFRQILIKNELGKWESMGCVGRFGASGNIITNQNSYLKMSFLMLTTVLSFEKEEAMNLCDEMSKVSIAAAEAIENYSPFKGGYGNFGVDIAIDRDKRLWLIEINNRNPRHELAALAGYQNIFEKTLLKLMLYAKKLSFINIGFKL